MLFAHIGRRRGFFMPLRGVALNLLEDIEFTKNDLEECDNLEDRVCIEEEICALQEECEVMREDWNPSNEPNMAQEIEIIKK